MEQGWNAQRPFEAGALAEPKKQRKLPPGVRMKQRAGGKVLYETKVKFPDETGKLTVARYAYGSTLEELAIAKADLLKKRRAAPRKRRQREDDPRRMTVRELAERWVDRHVAKLTESTDDYYRIALTYRIAPYLYDLKVADVTRRVVEDWMTDLLREPLRDDDGKVIYDTDGRPMPRHRARSINAGLATLKAMFGKAVDWGIVEANPCHRVRKLPEQTKAIRIYSPGEVERIVEAVYRYRAQRAIRPRGASAAQLPVRDATMVIVMAYCGLRLAEIAGLQLKHYDDGRERDADGNVVRDHELGWLLVEQQVELKTAKVKRMTKGKRYRRVPVLPTVRRALDWYLAAMPERTEDDFLFPSMQSTNPSRWSYLRHGKWRDNNYKPAAALAGFPNATPHELRHTFASVIIEHSRGNVSIIRLAEWMGHQGTSLIEERYGHVYGRVQAHQLHAVDASIFTTPIVADDAAAAAGAGSSPPLPDEDVAALG